MNDQTTIKEAARKLEWNAPKIKRFRAGDAESQRGATPDGGGGNQGS